MELTFTPIGISRLRMTNDGEGVTTLAAGYGCPLRCRYCLNPQCFCEKKPSRSFTVRELMEEVRVDDLYFQATGGGIVFGGGEPLLYAEFIHSFRKEAPKAWKIGLESSLAVPEESLQKILKDIDFYLIDIKDMNPQIYRAYTGRSNEKLLMNLRILADCVDPEKVTIRIPLIDGFNTPEDQIYSKAALTRMGFTKFDLFRYNITIAEEKRRKVNGQ